MKKLRPDFLKLTWFISSSRPHGSSCSNTRRTPHFFTTSPARLDPAKETFRWSMLELKTSPKRGRYPNQMWSAFEKCMEAVLWREKPPDSFILKYAERPNLPMPMFGWKTTQTANPINLVLHQCGGSSTVTEHLSLWWVNHSGMLLPGTTAS